MTTHLPSEPNPTMDALASPSQESASAGQLLQAAREQAGVDLFVLSQTLKVPVKQLEALESDNIDPAKGIVFFRGLAAAVCRHLQIDAAPVLARMPSTPLRLSPQKTVGQSPGPVMHLGTLRSSPGRQKRSVGVWAAGMLVLIAGLLWLPAPSQWIWLDDVQDWVVLISQNDSTPDSVHLDNTAQANKDRALTDPQVPLDSAALPLALSQASDASSPAAAQNPSAVPPSTAVAPPPLGANAPAPSVLKDNAAVKPDKSTLAEWVFTASADSWIELRKGPSQVVWSGVVKAGQSKQVQSPVPVSVVIGRAQGVSVTLRGQPFDLKPHTQVTVARFEVKE